MRKFFCSFVNVHIIQFIEIAISQLWKIISRKCPPFALMQAWARFLAFFITFCNISVGILRISLRILVLKVGRNCSLLIYTLDLRYPHKKSMVAWNRVNAKANQNCHFQVWFGYRWIPLINPLFCVLCGM